MMRRKSDPGRGRRRVGALGLGAIVLLAPAAQADEARDEARRATTLYEAGEYEAAAAAFERARQLAAENGEVPPTLDYNLGTALARQGSLDRALESLGRSVERPDAEAPADLRERAFYNLGVSEARFAEQLREQGEAQLQAEYETLLRALGAFRQSLVQDPSNEDARHNYALVRRRVAEIEAMQPPPPESGTSSSDQENDSGQSGEAQPEPAGQPPSGESGEQGSQGDQGSDASEGAGGDGTAGAPTPSAPGEDHEPAEQDSPSDQGDAGQRERQEEGADGDGRQSEVSPGTPPTQRGGLEATPTPGPTPGPAPGADGKSAPEGGEHQDREARPAEPPQGGGSGGGEASPGELTPEQLDALRVLNALEEGSPDQFKRLFQFRGGTDRDLERDW